jgi:peptidylprolyl isomerase
MLRKSYLFAVLSGFAFATAGLISAENDTTTKTEETAKAKESSSKELGPEDIRKLSEAFGNFIGRNLNTPGVKFDLESLIKGIREGAEGKPSPLSDEDYENMMAKMQEQAFSRLSEDNLKAANEFLAKNASADKVIVLEPGKLEYMVLEEGSGPAITDHSTPLIQYTGKYIDGTVFGSSVETGGPIEVPLDQTIPGFRKGLVGMKKGEKRRLFIHPDLGYGVSGQLMPNALLIFDIEVVDPSPAKVSEAEKSSSSAADDNDYDEDDEDEYEDEDNESKSAKPAVKVDINQAGNPKKETIPTTPTK